MSARCVAGGDRRAAARAARAQHGATAADVVVAEGDSLDGRRAPRRGREGEARARQAPRPARLRRRAQRGRSRPPTSRRASLEQLAADAVALARVTARRSVQRPAGRRASSRRDCRTLDLYDPAVGDVTAEQATEWCKDGEARGAATPIRASPTPRAPSSTPAAHRVLYASSNGFQRLAIAARAARCRSCRWRRRTARCSATTGTACSAISPSSSRRRRSAAPPRRARCAGSARARSATCEVPVVFDPEMAGEPAAPSRRRGLGQRALQGHVVPHRQARRAHRARVRQRRTTTARCRGGLGSKPFDGEGLPTRRTPVVERGVLTSYLFDTYSARKLQSRVDRQRGALGRRLAARQPDQPLPRSRAPRRRTRSSPRSRRASTSPS